MDNLPGDQPSAKITSGHPEKETIPLEELERLPELSPGVKEAGVAPIQGEIELPEGVPEGVTLSGPATPVATQPTGLVKLPLTDEQIQKARHQKIVDSILWLAYWCLRQIKIAHQKVKVYGKS